MRESLSAPALTVEVGTSSATISTGGTVIAEYVFRPDAPTAEAPKPYLHPLRTLSGAPLSVFRPADHRWHKGLQMTWSHVSGQNFWGGPTFAAGEGYRWIDNLGRIEHRAFSRVSATDDRVELHETLDWITSDREHWITERRQHSFSGVDEGRGLWVLDFSTSLENVRDGDLRFGSPTTHGRDAAGYAGFFWRGPRSFTSGTVLGPHGRTGDELMGAQADWVAYSGQHDEVDGGGTVLAFAGESTSAVPIRWFVRTDPFAAISPSPSFDQEIVLRPGELLDLRHRYVFIDRMCDRSEVESLAREFMP